MSRREMQQLCRELTTDGYEIEHRGSGHLAIRHPDLAGPVFAASSPSDWRAIRNVKAMLRRRHSSTEG